MYEESKAKFKHKVDRGKTFHPRLIIEYNKQGLASRNITEDMVAQVIRNTPGYNANYVPFPNASRPPSNSVFVFKGSLQSSQLIENATAMLRDKFFSKELPIIGRVFEMRWDDSITAFERGCIFDFSSDFSVPFFHVSK